MHNLLSRSQLDEWRHLEKTVEELELEQQWKSLDQKLIDLESESDRLNDYYECLIECDALDQHICKRICKNILNQHWERETSPFLQLVKGSLVMEKSRLKTIHKHLKEILAELESEIYSDKDSYLKNKSKITLIEEDDGYPD